MAKAIEALEKAWKQQYINDKTFPEWTKSQNVAITMPLLLPEHSSGLKTYEKECPCLMCDQTFVVPSNQSQLLTHLLESHRIVIADVGLISDMPGYISYWKHKLKNTTITEFCSVMRSKVKVKGEGEAKDENLFFLSDVLQEDRELRIQLQMKRLEEVLAVQEMERNDKSFKRSCLFCRTVFEGKFGDLFDHMARDHNFSVGQPNNLVFVNDFLNLLEEKLESMVCIFCEKVFKTREVLKEHMRKKGHKKVNPKNALYDKFYLVNYREFGKNWESLSKEMDGEEEELPTGFDSPESGDEESNWGDWKGEQVGAICLFCPANYVEMDELLIHMVCIHDFDFKDVRNSLKLDFYQQLKLINFIRRQIHLKRCIFCSEEFQTSEQLLEHMTEESHLKIPEKSEWDQPEFFFPTYENDQMLNSLDDVYESQTTPVVVVSEDLPESVINSNLKDQDFRSRFLFL